VGRLISRFRGETAKFPGKPGSFPRLKSELSAADRQGKSGGRIMPIGHSWPLRLEEENRVLFEARGERRTDWSHFEARICTGGPDVIRKEAWSFYRTISGVRLCWELEEPKGPKEASTLL